MNEVPGRRFDLRLQESINHFADLRIAAEHLGNPGLWSDDFIGYRPWAWPVLPRDSLAFSERIRLATKHLDEPVLPVLKMEDDADWLSQDAVAALAPGGKDPREVTFREVAASGSAMGTRGKDELDEVQVARMAAAGVSRWLRSLVLPAQDPFVDAPHLIARFPSLIGSPSTEICTRDRTAKVTLDLELLGLDQSAVADLVISDLSPWFDRALWRWTDVSELKDIPEVTDPWGQERASVVFLEDLSRFAPVEAAQAFAARVPTTRSIRFVVDANSLWATDFLRAERERSEHAGLEWAACDVAGIVYAPANLLAE